MDVIGVSLKEVVGKGGGIGRYGSAGVLGEALYQAGFNVYYGGALGFVPKGTVLFGIVLKNSTKRNRP